MGVGERAPHSLGGKQQVPTGWWPRSHWWVRSRSCGHPALSSPAPLPPPPLWREWRAFTVWKQPCTTMRALEAGPDRATQPGSALFYSSET